MDRMRQQFEVETLQALTRAAPDFTALDAAAAAAAVDGGAYAAEAAAQQPAIQRSGTINTRRAAWARNKMPALFARLQQQLGRAELLQLAPEACVTQTSSVLLLAGSLQCAPELPEAVADAPAADATRDAVRWLCSAGRHQAQGLLPAFWGDVLSAEELMAAPGERPVRGVASLVFGGRSGIQVPVPANACKCTSCKGSASQRQCRHAACACQNFESDSAPCSVSPPPPPQPTC
jgi:hypothetical protein